jgi:virulence-associated protein VapD
MGFAKTEAEWEERAAAFLKAEMKKAGVTYADLVTRLKKHGFKEETEGSVTMKLKRGKFNATWFLAALVAIGAETVKLEDI